jgi:two-component system response regulator AtoC
MVQTKEKILICDDDPKITYAVKMILERDGHQVITANNGRECLELLQADAPSVAFLDITMPEMSGLEVLEKAKEMKVDVPIIMITGYGTMETAIKAMHLGAYEYVTKPLDMEKIRILTRRVLETQKLKNELAGLRRQMEGQGSGDSVESELPDDTIVGKTPAIQEVFKIIGIVSAAPITTSVLIRGESGTGKELVARAIHRNSANKTAPFVAINCTAVPENLLESELFGHEKGAFTGATERRLGKLEIAKNGTLFFDEIGDLSPNLQQKLLRLLQEREFERVGGNQVMKVESRFIFATHRNLEEQVKTGHFREDLFFRINVISIVLPPLRERKEDIPLLVHHFITKLNRKLGKEVSTICPQAMEALMQYEYPGNVRELGNIIERSMTLSAGAVLTFDSLPEILKEPKPETFGNIPITSLELEKARRDVLNAFEKKFLEEILRATHGNVEEAARQAKVRRQSFYRLLKKYAISPKDFKSPLSPEV